jgi:hypothetical protein
VGQALRRRQHLRKRLAALEGSTGTDKAALAEKLGAVAKGVDKQLWATLGVYPSIRMTSIPVEQRSGNSKDESFRHGGSRTGSHLPQRAEPS